MSDHKFDKGFDDMKVDQKYKDEEMFSQLAQKEQDLESAIDMVEKEIQRKNERIIELESMLEETEHWFNLKSHMVKILEGELNHVHARHSERITDDEAIDVTINEKIRAEEEKAVLPPEQTGSSYDGEDGADKVGYEKKVNTCFDIIFEKPKKYTSKPKLSSEKRKIVNLIPNVTDQIMIKSNESKDDIGLEKNKNVSFDIMFEKTKKRISKPKLSSEKRKPINLIPNVTDQNIKSNENKEDAKYEEKKNNSFENKEDVRYEEKKNISFENKEDVGYEEKKDISFENKEDVGYEEKKDISFEIKEDVRYEEKKDISFENKEDVGYEEKKDISFENKEDVGYKEKKDISFENKEDVGYEEKKNNSFENKDVRYEEKKNISFENKEDVGYEEKKDISFENKEDVRYEEKKDISFQNKEDARYEENKNISFENKEDVGYEEMKDISFENKEDVRYEVKKDISFENKEDVGYEEKKDISFENKEDVGYEEKKDISFENKEDLGYEEKKNISFENKEDVGYEEKKDISFENKEDVGYEEKKDISFENKEDVRYEEKKDISFENKEGVRYEEKKKNSFENKEDVGYEEKKDISFENKEDVGYEEKKDISFENKEDVRYEEKKNISFDIVFDSHKKQRTKPKLTSGGRKAQFQLKHIDENKANSHDNEQKEDAPTADRQTAVKNRDSAYKEEQAVKKNVCFDVFFESRKKLKPKPKLSFINRKQENEAKNNFDENDVQEEQKPEKSQKVPSQTTEVNLSIRRKLGGQFENDILIKREDKNEMRFRFSFFHGTTTIPSRIPVMVRTRLNKRLLINSARRIPVRVLRITQTNKVTKTGPLAVRSFPKSKISVKRGTDIKINSTQIAKSPNGDDRRSSRRRERCTKLPRNRNLISPNPVSIGEKCKSPCPGLTSQFLYLPSKTTQNAKVKSSHSVSASGLTRHTQIKGRKESVNDNNIVSPSAMARLPPIVKRNDTYINRPLSASGFAKLPPINSTNKTLKMDRPRSASLSPLLTTLENTEKRPLSACGSPKLPPIIDENPLQMCRPTSSLCGYSLLPPISSYKRGLTEDDKVPVEDSNRSNGN